MGAQALGASCAAATQRHPRYGSTQLSLQPLMADPAERIDAHLEAGRILHARSLVHQWLEAYLQELPAAPSREQLLQPALFKALADVVERSSDQGLLERFWSALDQVPPPTLPAASEPLPVLGVPLLNGAELLLRLLDSLDHPVGTLAVVDNSVNSRYAAAVRPLLDQLEQQGHPLISQIQIARGFGNQGVAASWNQILMAFPNASAIALLNHDVVLSPGALQQALEQLKADAEHHCKGVLLPLLAPPAAFSAFLITPKLWDTAGLFNPAFHPAYLEDLEFSDRLRDLGLTISHHSELQEAMAAVNTAASATISHDPAIERQNQSSFQLNRLWYFSHRRLRHDPRGSWLRRWLNDWQLS